MSWNKLSPNTRSKILGMVVSNCRSQRKPGSHPCSMHATVCREWRAAFERRTFWGLAIAPEDIGTLESYFGGKNSGRRRYLKKIVLMIRLDNYDCSVCQRKESLQSVKSNNRIFSTALLSLLVALSPWRLDTSEREPGLTLELLPYCPSDCMHSFRKFGPNDPDEPLHGWVNGTQTELSQGAKERFLGQLKLLWASPLLPSPSDFPQVEVITGLLMKRQCRRIDPKSVGELLQHCLPRLEWFRHEAWRHVLPEKQALIEKRYRAILYNHIPGTVQEMSLFESFNNPLHSGVVDRAEKRNMGQALRCASRRLEHFSQAFLADAIDFFTKPASWANLRTLALTSPRLHPTTPREDISRLLECASRSVASMPCLEMMELWNGGRGHICIIRYSKEDDGSYLLSWVHNWNRHVQFLPCELQQWRALSRDEDYPNGNLRAQITSLDKKRREVRSCFGTIELLKLRRRVVDPITDFQLRMEDVKRASQ